MIVIIGNLIIPVLMLLFPWFLGTIILSIQILNSINGSRATINLNHMSDRRHASENAYVDL